MSSRTSFLAAALFGCSGTTLPGTTTETGETGGALAPAISAGDCAVDTSAAIPLAGARQVVLETYGYGTGVPDGLATQVFTDQAAYDAFLAGAGLTGAVDFTTEAAVAVTYGVNSTCGLVVDGWDAWDVDGAAHVEVRALDSSFACETVCDMTADLLLVIAVPLRATAPTVCGRVGGGCGEAP